METKHAGVIEVQITGQEPDHDLYLLQLRLNEDLLQQFGPLISGNDLYQLLGYRSSAAFRQARHRNALPIPTFSIPKRRGVFALSQDIASWLARLRLAANAVRYPKEGWNDVTPTS